MAVRKKEPKAPPAGSNLRAATVAEVDELMGKHMPGILAFLEDSEDKKQTVTFTVNINCAESEPKVDIGIRYSQSQTDSRTVQLDHPDQGSFSVVVKEAEKETEKRREKNLEAVKGAGKGKGKGRGKKKGEDQEPAEAPAPDPEASPV